MKDITGFIDKRCKNKQVCSYHKSIDNNYIYSFSTTVNLGNVLLQLADNCKKEGNSLNLNDYA